jgi:hypothetical protein
MSTDAICTCSHGLGVLRHADDCPVAIERRQPVRLAALSAPSEPVPDGPRVLGYVVLIQDSTGHWCDDWDGRVHETEFAGWSALAEARESGYETVSRLAALHEVVEEATP